MPDTLRELGAEERSALALLDDGADIETAMAATGLTHEQIVDANNLRAVTRRTNGGLTVTSIRDASVPVPAVDVALPEQAGDRSDSIAALLDRAEAIGGKRAQFLVDRINHDLADLAETLAEDRATYDARQRVAAARAELESAEAALRDLVGGPAPRKVVAKKTAKRPAKRRAAAAREERLEYSAEVREWARANGYVVGANGRMKKEVVDAYQAAHSADAQVG